MWIKTGPSAQWVSKMANKHRAMSTNQYATSPVGNTTVESGSSIRQIYRLIKIYATVKYITFL